jgi:hypothetical protein
MPTRSAFGRISPAGLCIVECADVAHKGCFMLASLNCGLLSTPFMARLSPIVVSNITRSFNLRLSPYFVVACPIRHFLVSFLFSVNVVALNSMCVRHSLLRQFSFIIEVRSAMLPLSVESHSLAKP